eukprot:8060440-Pyramimonas_sp.AAC.1
MCACHVGKVIDALDVNTYEDLSLGKNFPASRLLSLFKGRSSTTSPAFSPHASMVVKVVSTTSSTTMENGDDAQDRSLPGGLVSSQWAEMTLTADMLHTTNIVDTIKLSLRPSVAVGRNLAFPLRTLALLVCLQP